MSIELTDLKFTQEQISREWPNVTYHGVNCVDLLMDMEGDTAPKVDNQECFLGWLPDKDLFIIGFDVWGEEDDYDVFDVREDYFGGLARLVKAKKRLSGGFNFESVKTIEEVGGFYNGDKGLLSILERLYPGMIGLRYD